ncbi:MAG: HPr(Ser) kinase/phosphatase [Ignavibacteriales bacterium]|nr:MAG: HPr(Ser) kinase/phosphatase [Ignavibacteriaceae bacterium]MBW7872340.1 HPr(Ser) kinase/phosphatase [Ignavibacteria bacterium]MCZ2142623.1 HPr(Ser) kinase/phosphatase [Ignavibacteriales bacterium]OQY74571.1 MAG: HPr(Ser) kinase/phosphatase [Ignavibacteriales bacterium UTCHB3]MBV6445513.1 HPr kinase/phosphorylase [Ignavibacteriaceae bacterium]
MELINRDHITVEFFFNRTKDKFKITNFTGERGFTRKIKEPNLHRPGLALAGFVDLFSYSRIQIFGNTEIRYLQSLDSGKRRSALEGLCRFDIPCMIISNGIEPFPEMMELSEIFDIAIFGSPDNTTRLNFFISDFLNDQFLPQESIHGSLIDVYGVGILFTGQSSVGKSEVALDLVERGHRLVADDVVIATKKGEGLLMGTGTDISKHFMEIRGLGLINVEKIFGIRSIRYQKRIEVVVNLEIWDANAEYTRTGLDDSTTTIMEVELPYVRLPIVPGKNITVITEVIALNYLLKHYGYDSAKVFQDRLARKLKEADGKSFSRGIDYFEHDFE